MQGNKVCNLHILQEIAKVEIKNMEVEVGIKVNYLHRRIRKEVRKFHRLTKFKRRINNKLSYLITKEILLFLKTMAKLMKKRKKSKKRKKKKKRNRKLNKFQNHKFYKNFNRN